MFAIDKYKLVIFDMDGVIYRGPEVIPGVPETIKKLNDRGIKVAFNTNNSTGSRQMYVDRFAKMGVTVVPEEIFTSAYIAALALARAYPPATKVFVVGEEGLVKEMELAGFKPTQDPQDLEGVGFVIVGLDREFSYARLRAAMQAILRGASFYATNEDITWPMAKELWPGAGTMVAAIATAVGRRPEKVFGKPSPAAIDLILQQYKLAPKEVLSVGDRFETDMAAGNAAHTDTLLVLTGIATSAEVAKQPKATRPMFVLDSAADILK